MQYHEIIYDKRDKVAVVTLNRPARLNAITPTLAAEFKEAMLDAERDTGIAAIIVTGAGKSFCPGMDMAALQSAAGQTGQAEQPAPSSTNIDHHSLFAICASRSLARSTATASGWDSAWRCISISASPGREPG
jgi:enoyl-CoA hydratase/carnithine racemase